MSKLIIFDFDETIVSKDTYREFLIWLVKRSVLRSLVVISLFPVLGVMFNFKCSKLSAVNLLSFIAIYGQKQSLFSLRNEFVSIYYTKMGCVFYEGAKNEIDLYNDSSSKLLILSGCPNWLLKGVLKRIGLGQIKTIGSKQKLYYGALKTIDYCYAENKVRMAANAGFMDFKWVAGYSDSMSDSPFLELCSLQYIVNANSKLEQKFSGEFGESCQFLSWL